ncbi:putative pentatricopeptide repeat-containing protein [Hibiscus syriacus]|uniref:mitogen-activated protein kinase kinase kinase n=1 Tax=Hibiscus syriacus TaxID=106335 RepID=A0A6A2ZC07_HIBSY|nr:putative pentatricopeptide repeat-containing protein [Hibiscus syriacus]
MGSRGPTSPTYPLHHRLSGVSLVSPTRKKEDGKSLCHKLLLPPGSPTSPSALSSTRTCGMSENSPCNLSKWRKGRLLGRGTFGHVYLGFNSESGQMCAIKEVGLLLYLNYMIIECLPASLVVMNTNGYNLAVDIWNLGCTILEMATSKPPWSRYEWVAAIFKIGNSKDMPEIPDHLSNEAKSFIRLCLQREPSARPTALQLLDHPFIHYRATTRVANISLTKDAFPYTFDGSRTPEQLQLLGF